MRSVSLRPFSTSGGQAAFRSLRWSALGLLALGFGLASPAQAQRVCLTAILDGAQETPPVVTPAKGTAVAIVDLAANTLTFQYTFDGLVAGQTAAHIHGFAPAGTPAGVKFSTGVGNHRQGVWNYSDADEPSILAGLTYINIHSTAFPGGEIRGQLVHTPADVHMGARLDGLQEVPSNASPALGTGFFLVDTALDSIQFSITYTGLSAPESNAHIHGFAPPGTNAGVQFGLSPGFHKNGTWFYPGGNEASILGGLTYVNIHSTAFPGGEIRGQVVAVCEDPQTYCVAGATSNGCTAAMGSSGTPSLSNAGPFTLTCTGVEGGKNGIFFYSIAGPNSAPWGNSTSFLCVKAPTQRMNPPAGSGGTNGQCDGSYARDWNAYVAANPAKAINQALLAGSLVTAQAWFRDPAAGTGPVGAKGTALSDGLMFSVRP